VAEKFGFDEILGDGRAVDREERALGAERMLVDAARDELLARAAFAGDEHGRVARSDLADGLQNFLHRLGAADDTFLVVGGIDEGTRGLRGGGEVAAR